jgi:16S rRNA (adenine(1408)-N(1))-methyltransferase
VAGLGAGYSRAARRGLQNALFVVATAEQLPAELAGVADEVRIQFPWGSLLRLALGADPGFLRSLAGLLKPDGRLAVALSITARDRVAEIDTLDERAASAVLARLEATGDLRDGTVTAITPTIAKSLHSTWANRLRVGHSRPGWLLETNSTSAAQPR